MSFRVSNFLIHYGSWALVYLFLISAYAHESVIPVFAALCFVGCLQAMMARWLIGRRCDDGGKWLRQFYQAQGIKFALTLLFFWVTFTTMQQGFGWVIVTVVCFHLVGWLLPDDMR
jgi:hypothetical protein